MNINFKNSNIVRNSSGSYHIFYLNERSGIDCEFFNSQNESKSKYSLVDTGILDFSASIDEFDTIHMISLNTFGKLIYFTNRDETWHSDIVSDLDLMSNNYKYLNILIFNDSVGFLCSYSNLINPLVCNIKYVSIKPNFEKKNIISIISDMSFNTYDFAVDKFKNVHLLLRTIENKFSHIYYMSFSPFLNVYKKPPIKISQDNSNHDPHIFINSRNHIYALWTQSCSSHNNLKCMIMTESENKFKSLDISNVNSTIRTPIMMEEKNTLKVIYSSDSSLGLISSDNFGSSWSKVTTLSIEKDNLNLSRYSTNYLKDKENYNMSHSYSNIGKSISIYCSDIFNTSLESLEESMPCNISIDLGANLKSNSIDYEYIDKMITSLEYILSKDLIKVDNELISYSSHSEALKKIEVKLTEHRDKNNDLVGILNSLRDYYEKNSKTIEKLQYDLDYLKEHFKNQNNSFFKNLLSKFK